MLDLDFEIKEQIREALSERAVDYFQVQSYSLNDALNRISTLETKSSAQEQTVSMLRSQVDLLQAERDLLTNELKKLRDEHENLKTRFETLESDL